MMSEIEQKSNSVMPEIYLETVQARLDALVRMPASSFTRRHGKQLQHIRTTLREISTKLPPRRGPIGRPRSEDADDKGKEGYELRLQLYSWKEVAERTGCQIHRIMDWVKRYAERNGKPWPVGPAAPGIRKSKKKVEEEYSWQKTDLAEK